MKSRSKTPLFLMEVIIMLLVFSVSAAVCLRVFAEAKIMSEDSRNIDRACNEAQKVAEYWQGTKGNLKEMVEALQAVATEDGLVIYYDEAWQPTTAEDVFSLHLRTEGIESSILVEGNGKEIFTLETKVVLLGE